MNLQSEKSQVNKSAQELFEFLTNTANFKALLPNDLTGFEVSEDSFKFSMSGMPAIRMIYTEKIPNTKVQLKAAGDAFPVFLTCSIKELSERTCEAQLFFDGDINMMMAMMIKKPLQNLLDTLAEKMSLL